MDLNPTAYTFWVEHSKHSSNILNFSTGKPCSTEILIALASGILRRKKFDLTIVQF